MSRSVEAALRALEPWRARHRRSAWLPVVSDLPGPEGARSQFGGAPSLLAGEAWPACPHCREPLSLFVQLDIAALPAEIVVPPGRGLLQVFYCTNAELQCDSVHDGWSPFSTCHVVRIVDGPTAPSPERPRSVFPRKTVVGWERFDDLPHPEDHEQLGLTYDYDFPGKKVRVLCAELGVDIAGIDIDSNLAEAIGVCAPGDKLGGWPAWIQGAEYPACPRCSTQMTFVLQIDSEDHVPFMFGDVGCGHVTQCPRHPDVLAFAWACS